MPNRKNAVSDRDADRRASNVSSALDELARLVCSPVLVSRIWNDVLTQQERDQITGNGRRISDLLRDWADLRRISQSRAVIELAHELDLLSDSAYRRWLRELGDHDVPPVKTVRPHWDDEAGQLWYGRNVVKTVRQRKNATRIIAILKAFQEEGWPARIDDPLPGAANASQRMHDAIKSLNDSLQAIRFHGDGSGEGIAWTVV